MKAGRIAPIAVVLGITMLALPACAAHRSPQRGDAGLVDLSHRLVAATSALHAEVARSSGGRHHLRQPALRSIARLDRDARGFQRMVRREGARDRDTRIAFQRLEASYRHANETVPVVHLRRGIRRDFARVAGLIAQVDSRLARAAPRRGDRRYGSRHDGRTPGFLAGSGTGWRLGWIFGR